MWLIDKIRRTVKQVISDEPDESRTNQIVSDFRNMQNDLNLAKQHSLNDNEKEERVSNLTARERDAYLLLIEGFTLREVAKQLGISYSTANTHSTGVYRKLNVNTRAELIIHYRNIRK